MHSEPWNNWFHVCGSTFGTWVRGDERGWRARHHREHVIGDYKDPPPPGKYQHQRARSAALMKRRRVVLNRAQREAACLAFAQKLLSLGVELIDLCIGAKHWHGLLRCIARDAKMDFGPHFRLVRKLVGQGKGLSARHLSKSGLAPQGGLWAKRFRAVPIKDRRHQLNVARYIPAHARKDAAVYSLLVMRARSHD